MGDFLTAVYPWTKSLHVISMIAWMAGIFYLPRLFVYHAETATVGSELSETLKVMERKLLKVIINPAGVSTWSFGLALLMTPGVVDWTADFWAWVKAAMVIGMTGFHHSLVKWQRSFENDGNAHAGRYFRMMNEVPTVLMVVIVIMVIVKPF